MKIIADVDYVAGHIRYGHWELKLSDKEYNKYKNLSEKDKISWIEDGNVIVDDYRIYDIGTITEIREEND